MGAALDNPVPRTEGRVTYIDGLLAVSVLVGLTLNALADAWWADPLAGFVIVYYGIEESDTLMLDALVRRDRDDPAVDLEHDRLAIQGPLGGVIAPPKQSRQDLGDLVHPLRARVRQRERFECRRIVSCRIANDHFFARATGIVLPVADHFVVGPLGDAVTLRPFARLRRVSVVVAASAAEIRWIVDQRASNRPFSIREISACGIPERAARSDCVQPRSIRRSRIESPR